MVRDVRCPRGVHELSTIRCHGTEWLDAHDRESRMFPGWNARPDTSRTGCLSLVIMWSRVRLSHPAPRSPQLVLRVGPGLRSLRAGSADEAELTFFDGCADDQQVGLWFAGVEVCQPGRAGMTECFVDLGVHRESAVLSSLSDGSHLGAVGSGRDDLVGSDSSTVQSCSVFVSVVAGAVDACVDQ